MADPPLTVADMAATTLLLAELALSTAAGNGGAAVNARVRYTLSRVSLANPETALRCPHVRAVLSPETLAVVLSQASARPATQPAAPPPETADSGAAAAAGTVNTAAAARLLGVSPQAVRAAAKRGTLRGQHDRITGAWVLTRAAVEEYAHARGR